MESEIRTENSFLFYRSFYEAICDLPDEQQLKLFHAICEYGLYEKENSQLPGIANTVWKLIVPNLRASRIKRLNGRKGGRPCKEEKPEVKERNNHRFSNHETTGVDTVKSNKEREKEKEKEKDITTTISPPGNARSDAFDNFWKAYPRHVAKDKARSAFRKVPKSEVPALMAALEQHKRSEQWTKDGGQFIPHPATFLNQQRWTDELMPTTRRMEAADRELN